MKTFIIDLFKDTPDYNKYSQSWRRRLFSKFSVYKPDELSTYGMLVVKDEKVFTSIEKENEIGIFFSIWEDLQFRGKQL